MKKIVLVDGNNLLFRSYYATAYTGNIMRTSKGVPTNGLFGFVNMINKIIHEEEPLYIMVAFDIGKTFRHDVYGEYKGGRIETPDDLKVQFPIAKKILEAMGIVYLEKEGYEADDIIGTFAKMIDNSVDYTGLIVSSDKDLLQLISDKVSVKLLKSKDYVMMNENSFFDTYGIKPIRMIDLKALMGDSSDNIPGVKGVGEKTALKLLCEYESLENLYENVDKVKGALHDKLVSGREMAFMSKEMVTIYKDVPLDLSIDDIVYKGIDNSSLVSLYEELEFHSFLKILKTSSVSSKLEIEVINDISKLNLDKNIALWLELDGDNYHSANILGGAIYDGNKGYYIDGNDFDFNALKKYNIWTYDSKRLVVSGLYKNIELNNIGEDVMIMGYLLNYNVSSDVATLASDMGYDILFSDKKNVLEGEDLYQNVCKKAKFIYEMVLKYREEIEKEDIHSLYYDIELPLASVLARMEYNGINCDKDVLLKMGEDIKSNLDIISKNIYAIAGREFNISSPKQLGDVLFEEMKLPFAKKNKSGYVTDVNVLNKLKGYPIVDNVLEYRMLSKLYSTYIEGLINSIHNDGKIHTIYMQTLTRTGRLSSVEPNLQNIPVRSEYGRLIRKAFKPDSNSVIMSCDYSQIELRVFASLAKIDGLIEAFRNGVDIHTKTASDVFGVSIEDVSSDMRRHAKAVNFGIIYGISSYGLATDLGIKPSVAKEFIDNYMKAYPGINDYMENVVKSARECGYVKTIMNRKRVIDEINNTNYQIRSMGERMAMNTPIQGSSADILKKAMVDIDLEFRRRNLKSKMLLQVHDELIFNVYLDEKDIVESIVVPLMENAYKLEVPLEVSVDFGYDWYDAK